MSTRRFVPLAFAPRLGIYMLMVNTALPFNIDALMNTPAAWSIGAPGTVVEDLFDSDDVPVVWEHVIWLFQGSTGHIASRHLPGASMVASPLYAAIRADAPVCTVTPATPPQTPDRVPVPPLWPPSAPANVSATLAVTFLGLGFLDFLSDRQALVGALMAGPAPRGGPPHRPSCGNTDQP